MEKNRSRDSDEERWTRPFQSAKDPANLLEFVPGKNERGESIKTLANSNLRSFATTAIFFEIRWGACVNIWYLVQNVRCLILPADTVRDAFQNGANLPNILMYQGWKGRRLVSHVSNCRSFLPQLLLSCTNVQLKTALQAAGKGAKSKATQIQYNSW